MRGLTLSFVMTALVACGGAVERDGTSSGSSSGTGTTTPPSTGSSSSSSTGGVTTPTPSAGSCAPSLSTPVLEDFEKGLNPTWGSTNAAGFAIDQKQPISGTGSLRATFKGSDPSFLTIRVPSVCSIKLSFSVRFDADFSKSDATFLRIATEKALFHFRVGGGFIQLVQTGITKDAAYMMPHPHRTAALPDVATKIGIDLDVIKGVYEISAASEGDPTSPSSKGKAVSPTGELVGAINTIDIGTAPNVQSIPAGSFWLDDFTIE